MCMMCLLCVLSARVLSLIFQHVSCMFDLSLNLFFFFFFVCFSEYKREQDVGGSEGGATGSRTDMNSPSGRSNSQIARAGTVRKNINR